MGAPDALGAPSRRMGAPNADKAGTSQLYLVRWRHVGAPSGMAAALASALACWDSNGPLLLARV